MMPRARLVPLALFAAVAGAVWLVGTRAPVGACPLRPLAHLAALHRGKDRGTAPTDAEVDGRVTLDAMLAPGDDRARFDARRGAEVEGRVVDVKVGGVEIVNCFARDPRRRDTHVELALDSAAPETSRVIVEVTPTWRAAMAARGVDWTTDGLRATLLGRRVRVRGWLLFDGTHANESARTDPDDTRGGPNWRATAWEIHPVTRIAIVR